MKLQIDHDRMELALDANMRLYAALDSVWAAASYGVPTGQRRAKCIAELRAALHADKLQHYSALQSEINQAAALLGDNLLVDNYHAAIVMANIM